VKGERLGEFEELLLLAVQAMDEDTYVVPIQQYLERITARRVSLGAVYAGLDRLELKGFVRSTLGDATPERGGKRKRLFSVTREGKRTVQEVRRVREAIWRAIERGAE
jgi:PadR family transcriptional regulator, regulatory protein PadR